MTKTDTLPSELMVYLALRHIFVGERIHVRESKEIRKIIQEHKLQSSVQEILRDYRYKNFRKVAKALLEAQVFASIVIARARFPGMIIGSPVEEITTPYGLPGHDTVVAQSFMNVNHREAFDDGEQIELSQENRGDEIDQIINYITAGEQQQALNPYSVPFVASPDPMFLPFAIQHRLFVKIQYLLENACFEFAQENFANVLKKRGWDCAEAVELNNWPKIFLAKSAKFNLSCLEGTGRPFPVVLDSMIQLRHGAVHRHRYEVNVVSRMVTDAELFVKLLAISEYIKAIATLRAQMQVAIQELEKKRNLLKLEMADIRLQFAQKRAELDREECDTLEAAVKADKERATFATRSLSRTLNQLDLFVETPASAEDDLSSGNHSIDGEIVESIKRSMSR